MIPRGTGVDFVRTSASRRSSRTRSRVALRRRRRATIDAGRVGYRAWSGEAGEAWFVNVAGVGMSGAVAKRTNESSKALGGKVSYLWSTLAVFARWQNTEVRVSVDGEEPRRGRMHEVIVANGRYLGGGMLIVPRGASPDDGLFDVLLIGDVTKADLVKTMPKIYRGTHLPHPKAELLRGAAVTRRLGRAAAGRARRRAARDDAGAVRARPEALRLRVPG